MLVVLLVLININISVVNRNQVMVINSKP